MKRMMQQAKKNQTREIPDIPIEYMMNQALETLISFELIFQKAAELGISVTPEELDKEITLIKKELGEEEFKKNTEGISEDVFKGSVMKSLYVKKVMQEVMPDNASKVTDKEIEQYYRQIKNNLQRNYDMIKIAHIFFKLPENAATEEKKAVLDKAYKVKKLLNEGADWTKTVIKYSDAIIDHAEEGQFVPVPSFMNKIVKGELPQEVGETSDVLETKDGFVIVKLFDRKAKGGYLTLEEARNTIENMLESKKTTEYVDKYVRGLKSKANVKIYIQQHGR